MGKHGTQGTHSDVVHTDTSTRPAVREVVCGLRSVHLHRDRLNGWSYLSLKLKSGRLGDLPAFARRPPILYPHFHASFTHSEKNCLSLICVALSKPTPEAKQWETENVFSHSLCAALPTWWTSCWILTWKEEQQTVGLSRWFLLVYSS